MVAALCVLQCLHFFWFTLIIAALKKKFAGEGLSDIREEELSATHGSKGSHEKHA